MFQFAIERSKANAYNDMKGKPEVVIVMKGFKFVPENVIVSKNTQVTWINEDDAEHFVNTDSHPAHTYYPQQNSRGLKKGDKFSLILNTPGIYPYHCSAHTTMTGSILVE